jgi:hypothetical protein
MPIGRATNALFPEVWKDRIRIDRRRSKLIPRQPDDHSEIGVFKMRSPERGSAQIGAPEDRPAKIGMVEFGPM